MPNKETLPVYVIFRIIFIYLTYNKRSVLKIRIIVSIDFLRAAVFWLFVQQHWSCSSVLGDISVQEETSRPLQIHSSPYFFPRCLFLVMSGQKQKRRESGFFLPKAAQMPRQREAKFILHKPHVFQLEQCCLWLVTGKERCFKTFNTESAHCRVSVYCLWPLAERSHAQHMHFSAGLVLESIFYVSTQLHLTHTDTQASVF